MPDNPSVNKPASGTYGEQAAVDALKQSLPPPQTTTGPGLPAPTAPDATLPDLPTGRPLNAPGGVPSVLLQPTDRPDVPVSTPLAGPAPMLGGAQTAAQARLALLDALANSPEVSETTREWARMLLELLTGG